MENQLTKVCSKCRQEKPIYQYNKGQYHCKLCHKILHREYYLRTRPPLTRKLIAEQNKIKRNELKAHRHYLRSQIEAHRRDFRNQINAFYGRKYRREHGAEYLEKSRALYRKNRIEIIKKNEARRKKNFIKYNKKRRERYSRNRTILLMKERARRFKNIDEYRRRVSEKQKDAVIKMKDSYIKQLILYDLKGIKRHEINKELVDFWRLNLTLKRLKKEKFKCQKILKQ